MQQEELCRQLINAVLFNKMDEARELIEAGVDVNQANPDGLDSFTRSC